MGSPLLGIDHVALRALDMAATEWFYGEVLGLPVVDEAEPKKPRKEARKQPTKKRWKSRKSRRQTTTV